MSRRTEKNNWGVRVHREALETHPHLGNSTTEVDQRFQRRRKGQMVNPKRHSSLMVTWCLPREKMEAESERLRSHRRFSNRESKPWFPWRRPTGKARSQGHVIQMLVRRSPTARGHVHTLAPDSQAPPIPLYRSKQWQHSNTNFR